MKSNYYIHTSGVIRVIYSLSFVFLIVGFSSAQTPLSYSKVNEVPGVSKKELFQRAESWINDADKLIKDPQATNFNDGKVKASGMIATAFKGTITENKVVFINYEITLVVKDNRYKIDIADFNFTYTFFDLREDGYVITTDVECPYEFGGKYKMNPKIRNEMWVEIKRLAQKRIEDTTLSIERKMNRKSDSEF